MKNKILVIGVILITQLITSCVKDLDVVPQDPNTILSGNLTQDQYKQVLAKIYASFIINGQGANGGPDIVAPDNDFFVTARALWNCQELTTDEVINAWGDVGIADINSQTPSPNNAFLTALYQRLSLTITYANDFIRITKENTDPTVVQYNSEARFLRALAYYWAMDLFGNPPFTTDEDGVGKFYPKQLDPDVKVARKKLFNYIVTELKAIESTLGEPGFSYPRADKAAAWMLLARTYLNAEVFTATAKWDSCIIYTDKVINSAKFSLAPNYRKNFSADNGGDENPEMIFAFAQDGNNIQGNGGTTFLIESSCDAVYIRSEDFHGLTSNTNWNGNRTTKQFLNVLVDTLATYGNVQVPSADNMFAQCPDKRVFAKRKAFWDIPSISSNGDYGIGIYKFTAKNSDGSLPANQNPTYANTDWPVFRYADALLMKAESNFRLGNMGAAVADVNLVRERAYGNTSGNVTTLTEQFLLDERGREFYYEAQRRTDLIRFGQYTNGTYRWAWKGGAFDGVATDPKFNIFPIPGAEVASNPNIVQNPGY